MKTKIKFVQREDVDGVWYFTEKNGNYVYSSGSFNRDKAYEFFKKYIELTNKKPVVIVLETVEVDEIVVPF
jgi:hypothetical protein